MGPRAWTLTVMLACSAALPGRAQAPEPTLRRVRAVDQLTLQRMQDGFRRSGTFRQIVLALERSNVIVYVTPGFCESGRVDGCLLRFIHLSGNNRYLRIVVSGVLSDDRVISILGHELRHALEVADVETVTDGQSMLALFRRTGLRECRGVWGECYETQAAMDAEDAILKDLGNQYRFFRP